MFTRIGLKLIVAVGLIIIIIIGVFSYFTIQSQKETLMSQAEVHAYKLSDAIKKTVLTQACYLIKEIRYTKLLIPLDKNQPLGKYAFSTKKV